MSSCNIRVIARFRPFNDNERKNQDKSAHSEFDVSFPDETRIDFRIDKASHAFTFDRVFSMDTRQEDIYEVAAKPCIDDLLEGYNATIFAYGQTGSGKSFTMFGLKDSEELRGIIPRASGHIFSFIENDERDIEYAIKCAFLEIYKEKIYDLLSPNPKETSLKVRESPSKGVWVDGLHEEFIGSVDDIADLLNVGEQARTVSSTDMNARSSRSHSVFMIIIEQKLADGSVKSGKLNLVDLAGSERVAKTNVSAKQLEEAKDINKSLSTLGKCIHALSEQSKAGSRNVHIPFRESQLTRILQESLGGNCKTTLMITCSPSIYNADETLSTLRFGASAKTIKNVVQVNQKRSVEELEALLKNLQKELASLKAYAKKLEKQLGIVNPAAMVPHLANEAPVSASNELAMNLNLSPRPGTAPAASVNRMRSASIGIPPRSGITSDGGASPSLASSSESIGSEIEEWDPLALAELKTKYDELQKSTEMQIEQLKYEVKEAQEREANTKFELESIQDKHDKAVQKLDALRAKSAQDFTEYSLKIQKLEEDLREKTEEADESIIVLYADNERLENQVHELTLRMKELQLGNVEAVAVAISNNNSTPSKEGVPSLSPIPADLVAKDRKIIEMEASFAELQNKLRQAEDRENSLNKKLNAQKERNIQLTTQLSELTSKQELLKEENAEILTDKTTLEKELEAARAALKAADDKHAEQIKQMEKMIQKRARLFRPAKKKDPQEALKEKIDLTSHISTLKKTQSPFLEMARRDHERSQSTRGEELFGIKSSGKKVTEAEKEQYRRIFKMMDKDGSGTVDKAEMKACLKKLGKNISEDELNKLMQQLDKDGNGVVDLDEFIVGMTKVSEQN